MDKYDIRDLTTKDLTDYLVTNQQKPYCATQIFEWIYKKGAKDFKAMTNLSDALKDQLEKEFIFPQQKVVQTKISRDGTKKFLSVLHDEEKIETVLIPTSKRATVCVSTQVGCKFRCQFCASGLLGWKRDLSCAEMITQILHAKEQSIRAPLSHVVFMGIGEPLDNYDNLMKAIDIINCAQGLNISTRRITISTCGVTTKIDRLSKEDHPVELSVSLHGSNDKTRGLLMPINKKYPLKQLIKTCTHYARKTNRQITFEYLLIKNLTCTEQAARELSHLLKGMLCKLNLIPYNKVKNFDYEPPGKIEMLTFKERLLRLGVHTTIRMPRGKDIDAACGQLRLVSGE